MQTFDTVLAQKKRTEGAICRLRATKDNKVAAVQKVVLGFYYNVGHGMYYVHGESEAELRAKLSAAGFSPNEAIWE